MKKTLAILFTTAMLAAGFTVYAAPESTASPTDSAAPTVTASPTVTAEPSEPSATPEILSPEETAKPEITPEPSQSPDASDEPQITPRPPEKELSTEFKLDINVRQHKYIVSANAVIELYKENGEFLGSQLRYVGWDTPSVSMTFEVPEYRMSEYFYVKLAEGLRSIWYYDEMAQVGEQIRVQTYGYIDENGEYIQNNGASITGNPQYEKEVHLYITNQWYNDIAPRARVVDDIVMAPVRDVAEAMGLKVTYNPDDDSVVCALEDKAVHFWANNEYVAVPDGGINAPHKTIYIEGSMFVPVRTLAEAFDCSVEATDYGEFIDLLVGESPYIQEIRNRIPVNKYGIGSRTNYLVWVSKHEYKVRVFEGQQYHWTQLKEFPCALGAWNTPTVTGQFEYIERTRWDYGSYYVAPVLRFYNGYALHSTLLSYGGGEYDGRVGVNISHGCVRLHPQDINWIAATIPFHTRIYITE